MNSYAFKDIVIGEEGLLKGPFGSDLKKELYVPKGNHTYKVYLQENILKETNDVGNHYISEEYYKEKMSRYAVKEGDFIVTCDGTLGEIFQLKNLSEEGIISSSLLRITLNNDIVDDNYFYYLFKAIIKRQLITQGNNSVLKHLPGLNAIREHVIELPELDVQKKVGQVLRVLDDKIKNNTAISLELEAMAKTLFDYWFLQFDFPNEEGKPYKSSGGKMVWNKDLERVIPEIFECKSVQDIIDVKDGTHDSPKYISSGKYLITSKHLSPEGIKFEDANHITDADFEAINKRSAVDKNDILYSMIGAIGLLYWIDEDNIDFAIKNVALYKTSQDIKFGRYLYMTLKSDIMTSYTEKAMAGSIQKFMGLGTLREMPIAYNENIIMQYYEKTENIFEKMRNIKYENQELRKLRDFLLPLLMNGQVGFKE